MSKESQQIDYPTITVSGRVDFAGVCFEVIVECLEQYPWNLLFLVVHHLDKLLQCGAIGAVFRTNPLATTKRVSQNGVVETAGFLEHSRHEHLY
jgi:hypothetical protein